MVDNYLLNGVKVVLHALDSNVFARIDALGLEHLGKRSFSFLAE